MPHCLTPMDVRIRETNKVISVPCGKCNNCIIRKGSEWSFRIMQEERTCNSSHFITFTYANKYCPVNSQGRMALEKEHLQGFFKRLRAATDYKASTGSREWILPPSFISRYSNIEAQESKPIKYYAVGEYGGKTQRPHYHAIIFNADIELIFKSWSLGDIFCGDVNGASVGYTMKYMFKKGYQFTDRPPQFAVMSKGLGLSYITDKSMHWHNANHDRLYVNIDGGKKAAMPRYFKERMFDKAHRENAGIKQLARMDKERYTMRVDQDGVIWYDYSFDWQSAAVNAALISPVRNLHSSLLNNYL